MMTFFKQLLTRQKLITNWNFCLGSFFSNIDCEYNRLLTEEPRYLKSLLKSYWYNKRGSLTQ